VNSSVFRLREHQLIVPGTFKARFYPAFPILGVAICLLFIVNQSFEALQMGFWLAAIGLIIFLAYGRSRNRRHLEEMRPVRTAETVRVFELKLTMDNTVGKVTPITETEPSTIVKTTKQEPESEADDST
jgi:thiol:disulfide interchange protein